MTGQAVAFVVGLVVGFSIEFSIYAARVRRLHGAGWWRHL